MDGQTDRHTDTHTCTHTQDRQTERETKVCDAMHSFVFSFLRDLHNKMNIVISCNLVHDVETELGLC